MCFSLAWLESLLIYIVIVCAVVGIIRLLVPYVLSQLGAGGNIIMAALNIIMWAIICIFVIYICFALISCLGGFVNLSLMPRR